MAGKRFSSPSYLCSELVSITARRSARRQRHPITANLEAISEEKVLLLTEIPFKRGDEISIKAKAHILRGTVRQCKIDGLIGWYVEVFLKAESRWSEHAFRPEHLLPLHTLPRSTNSKCLALDNASDPEKFLPATCSRKSILFSGV